MAKNAVTDWSTVPASNSDIGGINIAEGCPAKNINNAIRELMAQYATFLGTRVNFAAGIKVDGASGILLANDDYLTFDDSTNILDLTADSSTTPSGTFRTYRLRLLSTNDASEVSSGHAIQVGPDDGVNLRIDNNEILTVNNGATGGALFIQNGIGFGSGVTLGISDGGTGAATAALARDNLGLTLGTSGATVPLLNGTNTWANLQYFVSGIRVSGASGVLFDNNDLFSFDDSVNAYSMASDGTVPGTRLFLGNIRLLDTTDASLSSTGHGFQIGADGSGNLIMDTNEIMARNNGAAANLLINIDGGLVSIGDGGLSTSGNIATTGNMTITNSAPQVIFSDTTTSSLNGRLRFDASNFYMDGAPDTTTWTNVLRFELDTKIGYIDGSRIWTDAYANAAKLNSVYGYTPVTNARQIIAGNGMTGGGALTADRTVTLGTPSPITNATTDSVTSTSHAHSLGFVAAEVYTGSSASYSSFGLGAVLIVHRGSDLPARNGTMGVSTRSDIDYEYITSSHGSAGTAMTGTWRSRGRIGDYCQMQRTA